MKEILHFIPLLHGLLVFTLRYLLREVQQFAAANRLKVLTRGMKAGNVLLLSIIIFPK